MQMHSRGTMAIVFIGLLSVWPAQQGRAQVAPSQKSPGLEVGKPVPAFTLADTYGKTRSLAEFKGKWVVLEWLNHECPFVVAHYQSGNMQRLQQQYTAKGVVWLSINSTNETHANYKTPDQANALTLAKSASPTAVLMDPEGTVGRLYSARTTPQLFVINPEGVLLYEGGIDDGYRGASDIAKAKNYLVPALDEAMAGKPVSQPKTPTYGCSVKYKK